MSSSRTMDSAEFVRQLPSRPFWCAEGRVHVRLWILTHTHCQAKCLVILLPLSHSPGSLQAPPLGWCIQAAPPTATAVGPRPQGGYCLPLGAVGRGRSGRNGANDLEEFTGTQMRDEKEQQGSGSWVDRWQERVRKTGGLPRCPCALILIGLSAPMHTWTQRHACICTCAAAAVHQSGVSARYVHGRDRSLL